MPEPKLSLFPSEGPPVAAPVPEAKPAAPAPGKSTLPPVDEDDRARRILAIAIADSAEVVRDLSLVTNNPNTEHTRTKVGLCLVAVDRVKHRLRWFLEGKMPDTAAEEAAVAAAFAERDAFRAALVKIKERGTHTVSTGDPELGPLTQLSPEAEIALDALNAVKRKEEKK